MCVSAETASPILHTGSLISMCENKENLNLLFNRTFEKIPIFDEEEDCQVMPERANGYKFTLEIQKFYQYIQFGGKSESQVSLATDFSNNLGIVVLDKELFNREFYFYEGDNDPSFYVEDKIDKAKECQLRACKSYLKEICDEDNTNKFENKRIEINLMKTAGVGDYRDQQYIQMINGMNFLPDRNKRKATYIK